MSLDDLNNNMTGLYAFIDTFRERIKPYAETIKIIEENAKKALEEFAEKMKPVHAFYILAEHQFTYWKPLCYDDIKQIIETQDVNTYLKERIEDKNFIDYDEVFEKMIQSALLSETNKSILYQSFKAMEADLYDLALVGVTSVFDGALTVATSDDSTQMSKRIGEIEKKIENLSDEEWELLKESERTAIGMYITWAGAMKGFQAYSDFSKPETEPTDLNRHWIAHGRKTTIATKLDCCKMINALYGLMYFGTPII